MRSALDAARLNLEFTEVRSPIDGRVSRALITAGNLVSNASVLTTVVSDDPVYAYFDADEQTYLKFATARRDRRAAANGSQDSGVHGPDRRGGLSARGPRSISSTTRSIRRAARSAAARCSTTRTAASRRACSRASSSSAARRRRPILIDERAVGTDLGKKFVLALKSDNTLEYRPVDARRRASMACASSATGCSERVIASSVNGLQHVTPGLSGGTAGDAIADGCADRAASLRQLGGAPTASAGQRQQVCPDSHRRPRRPGPARWSRTALAAPE